MDGHKKILTIVIPVHNRAGIVGRTLASIAHQEGMELVDIILVDNNSTDHTPAELKKWVADNPGISAAILSEPLQGACAARNRGLRAVSTPWTMFFDSDDEMLPGLLADLLREITAAPEADIIGWDITIGLQDGRTKTGRYAIDNPLWNHLMHGSLSTQRYACRTDLFRSVGGWDNDVTCWNDYELGVRLLMTNPRMRKLNGGPRVLTHFTPGSITGFNHISNASGREYSLDRCEASLIANNKKEAAIWIDARRIILAAQYKIEGDGKLAKRLKSATLRGKSAKLRLFLRLLYFKHLIYQRGTAKLGSWLIDNRL